MFEGLSCEFAKGFLKVCRFPSKNTAKNHSYKEDNPEKDEEKEVAIQFFHIICGSKGRLSYYSPLRRLTPTFRFISSKTTDCFTHLLKEERRIWGILTILGMLMSTHKNLLFVGFLLTILPIATLLSPSVISKTQDADTDFLLPPGTDTYSEDFTTTTYRDGITDAFGWFSGTVTKTRDLSFAQLDSHATGGPVYDIDVQGRKAYVPLYNPSTADYVLVIDLNDTSDIRVIESESVTSRLRAVHIEGDILSLARNQTGAGTAWLGFYNATDPSNLLWTGEQHYYTGSIMDLEVQGHMLYVAAYGNPGTFVMMNIEDLYNTYETYSTPATLLQGIDVDGDLVYMALEDELEIWNVSSAYSINFVGEYTPFSNLTKVVVDGDYCYCVDRDGEFVILDCSNPALPTLISSLSLPGEPQNLALQGHTVYVACGTGGLRFIDIEDITHPTVVASAAGTIYDVELYGGTVIVSTDTNIRVLQISSTGGGIADISNALPNPLTGYEFWDVRVQGDVAYIAGGSDGLITVDVSNPANPVVLDSHTQGTMPFYRKLDIQGNRAYIANYNLDPTWRGLLVYDITDPQDIKFLGHNSKTYALDVDAYGDVCFVADGPWVYVINVSDPYNPLSLDFWADPGNNVTSVWVQGPHLYAVAYGTTSPDTDILVFDISDLSNIKLIHSLEFLNNVHSDIFVDGDLAYIAADGWAVCWNVSDPFNPFVEFSPASVVGRVFGVWGFGPYVLFANYTGGIALYDARNLVSPTLISANNQAKGALQITVHGDYAYVANRTSLVIFRLFESYAATYAAPNSLAQSIEVDTTDYIIETATLTPTLYEPTGTAVDWYMSADGGAHWESVTPGALHTFANAGNDLRWRAILIGPTYSSPHIYSVTIDYQFNEPPSTPTLNDPGTTDTDGSFPVSWSASTDDSAVDHYELQMSQSNIFTTIADTWNPTGTSQPVTILTNGTYFFRVRAIDDDGLNGSWSNIHDIEVAIPPTTTTPTPTPPPIPGFPLEAIVIAVIAAFGLGILHRRKRQKL
jgi:hypothetical protein